MRIEIHQLELEALIQQRMESGAFQSVEDVLMQALKSSRPPERFEANSGASQPKQNLADFLTESPRHGSGLVLERAKDYPRSSAS